MHPSTQIKSISHLKSQTAQIIRAVSEAREPLIITQNGEAKAVLQDIQSYEETQDTLALLKILALGNRAIDVGAVQPADKVFERLRKRLTA